MASHQGNRLIEPDDDALLVGKPREDGRGFDFNTPGRNGYPLVGLMSAAIYDALTNTPRLSPQVLDTVDRWLRDHPGRWHSMHHPISPAW